VTIFNNIYFYRTTIEIIIERLDKIEKMLLEISKNNVSESQVSNSDEIMTLDQLAEYLSIARQTIYGKCSAKEIPCFKTGKRVYFMKSEINEWLKAGSKLSQAAKPSVLSGET
jgi:excisionase family DNA binding protein